MVPFRRRLAALLVATSVLVGLVASCDRGPQESTEPPPPEQVEDGGGGTLRFGLADAPVSLDPFRRPVDSSTLQVLRSIFDPLLVIDENSQLHPGLAAAVVSDATFTEFTITVRDGVSFSDGTPVDAAAVAASLEAARSAPDLAVLLAPIASIEVAGAGATGSTVGAAGDVGDQLDAGASDSGEVVVRMSEPWASFPYQLAGTVGMVVAPSMLAAPDRDRTPVGAGPYVLSSWTDAGLVLGRRDGYWQEGRPLLETIDLPVVPDPSVRLTQLADGTLDVTTVIEPEQMARVHSGAQGLQVLSDPSDETAEWVVVLNTVAPPFDEIIARQAVAFAIDRDAIVTRVFAGEYRPSKGPYSEGSRFYGDARWPILDIGHADDLAKQYTALAGQQLRFRLLVGPDLTSTELGRLLQSQLATVGVATDLEVADTADQLEAALHSGEFDAVLASLFDGAHPDEDAWLLGLGHPDGERPDPAGYESETLAEALVTARSTDDITTQAESYQGVQAELAAQLPYLFLVHGQGLIVAGPQVRGLTTWSTPDGFPGVRQTQLTVSLGDVWIDAGTTAGTVPGTVPDGPDGADGPEGAGGAGGGAGG